MIQISKMNKYWTMPVFVLFLLRPLLSFAEGGDPFDNTILTVEDSIPITEPDATKIYQNISSQPEITVALDQPINTRYPITQYSMQGLIKSPSKTKMMFVAIDENVKFLLSLNDCLGLDCGFVTDIDKRGRVTFEDEKGIYRFQVGYSPFIVENKIADMLQESSEVMGEDQPLNEEAQVAEQLSIYVEDLENDNAALDANNLILKTEIQDLSDSNIALTNEIDSLNKKIQESNAAVQELQNTITSQEQTLNQQQENIKKLQEEIQNSTLETTTSSDSTDIENLQNTIASLNATLENKSQIINEAENQIAIQEKQISSLKNDLNTMLSKSSTANSDIIQELQNTIETQEQTLDQQQENISQLKEELQNSSANTEITASSENVDTQNLQDTINSLNFELEKKSKTLNDAENKTVIQEKQISSLKNDLNNMLSDINEKLHAKQELINDLESQLLTVQSTTDPSSTQEQNEQSTDSTATQSTEITPDTNDIKGDNLMVAREDVNIREKPSPNSFILGVQLKDSTINVIDTTQHGWSKIITREGKEGYIDSLMLKEKN